MSIYQSNRMICLKIVFQSMLLVCVLHFGEAYNLAVQA